MYSALLNSSQAQCTFEQCTIQLCTAVHKLQITFFCRLYTALYFSSFLFRWAQKILTTELLPGALMICCRITRMPLILYTACICICIPSQNSPLHSRNWWKKALMMFYRYYKRIKSHNIPQTSGPIDCVKMHRQQQAPKSEDCAQRTMGTFCGKIMQLSISWVHDETK